MARRVVARARKTGKIQVRSKLHNAGSDDDARWDTGLAKPTIRLARGDFLDRLCTGLTVMRAEKIRAPGSPGEGLCYT